MDTSQIIVCVIQEPQDSFMQGYKKFVKEFTGHTFDAIDKYQVTSRDQRSEMSKVIQCEDQESVDFDVSKKPDKCIELSVCNIDKKGEVGMSCECKKSNGQVTESDQISHMISQLVSSSRAGKAKIKIEIEFSDK